MQANQPFPNEYQDDPKRRAEYRVYQQLAESEQPGLFIFEWKRDKKSSEVDFVVWICDIGTFAIQVKGGRYRYRSEDDEWYLRIAGQWERVPSPLGQTWSGADALINSIPKIRGYRSFVLPVLLFTDMDPDPDIQTRAESDKVHPMFREDDLPQQLAALAQERRVYYPPTDTVIATEALAITNREVVYQPVEHSYPDSEGAGPADVPPMATEHVTVHHGEHLH